MKHIRNILSIFAILLLLNFTLLAKDNWVKVTSKNFELVGNANENDIPRIAIKLEQFREAFSSFFPTVQFNSPIPTRVVVFKTNSDFARFKPVNPDGKSSKWVGGYFLPGDDANYISLSIEGEASESFKSIYHEYVHFLVDNNIGRSSAPPWYNEGIAGFYETLLMQNDQKAVIGMVNDSHLSLLKQSDFIPLDTFFNTDYYSLSQQGPVEAQLFYAQAWAFLHYMLRGNDGARQEQMSNFLRMLSNGRPAKDAFVAAFGTDYATTEKELRKYIAQLIYQGFVINFDNKTVLDREMSIESISSAKANAYLGDLLLHINRHDEAASYLEKALALEPNFSFAKASLGLVKLRQNKVEEACKYLETVAVDYTADYRTHYLYAYALSKKDMSEYGFVSGYAAEDAIKMYAALKNSIALKPDFTKAHELYAFVAAARNENIDEAINYLRQALKLTPGNDALLLRIAELYMRKESFSEARKIANAVFRNASTQQLKLYSQNTIQRIDSTEAQLLSIKANKNKANSSIVTDEPKSEEEIARLRAVAAIESVNQSLRKPSSDENRVIGKVNKIECRTGSIIFQINTQQGKLNLQTASFQALYLWAYNVPVNGLSLGCGSNLSKHNAVVTYKKGVGSNTNLQGEIISIEFVPAGFKFL